MQELHDGRSLKIDIWDTAGQERYRTLAPLYYRNASAAVVVFDVTSKESFDGSRVWASDFQERRPSTPLILVRYHLAWRSAALALQLSAADICMLTALLVAWPFRHCLWHGHSGRKNMGCLCIKP